MTTQKKNIMIGDRIRHLLEINGLNEGELDKNITRTTLMDELELTRENLQKYISNIRRPTLDTIVQMARIFNTNVDYLVKNSDYILDTWDYEFLKELFQYASEKITIHMIDKNEIDLTKDRPIEGIEYTIFYGLLTHLFNERTQNTFADLNKEEKEQRKEIITFLIYTFLACIDMVNKENFEIEELKALLGSILDYRDGVYSFKETTTIRNLENRKDISKEDKIELLKAYINTNMSNCQKAISLLAEISDSEK